MELGGDPPPIKETAPNILGQAGLPRAGGALKDDEAARLQNLVHLLRIYGLKRLIPDVAEKLLGLRLERLEDLPVALVRIEVHEGLHDLVGQLRVVGHPRVAVHLGAIALEDPLESREAIASSLGYRLVESRRIALGPCLDAELLEIAAQGDEAPAMAGLGQNALVRREAAGADNESDQAPTGRCWEPGEAGTTVGTGRRIVLVDEARERNAILLIAGGQGVGVADQAWLEVALLEALSEKPFQEWAHTLLGHGPKALADDVGESAQAVVGHFGYQVRDRCARDNESTPSPFSVMGLPLTSGSRSRHR